jgi:hypothetical protein
VSSISPRPLNILAGAALALLALALAGCAQAPVRPWERGHLADPAMVRDAGAHHRAFVEHFHASKEATHGGYGLGAGGCGCK